MFLVKYIKEVFGAVRSSLKGMRLTGYYALHHRREKITQQYPNNRETLVFPEMILSKNAKNNKTK